MQITRALTLLGGLVLVALSFYATPTDACSCMPSHPQTHYCNADYVALIRVMRGSAKLIPYKIVYKVEVKKSYKMTREGQRALKHGRIMTAAHDSMCGVKLVLGKLYVIAGRGTELKLCDYVKEYKNMTIIERTGFTGAYKKGCSCQINTNFGNYLPSKSHKQLNVCQWSPRARCETDYSACLPVINRSFSEPHIKCRWRRTIPYDECRANP